MIAVSLKKKWTCGVSCSDLWRSDKTDYEYLCENVAKFVQNAAFTDKHFERLWDNKDRLVVFDGLDEVPTTASTNVFLQKIGEFRSKKADDCRTRILFTSRNKDDANRFANDPTDIKSRLRSFELQPLNDDQIRKLCASLGKVFEFDDNDFFFKIKRLDKEIKTNPLLVSQLAIINNKYGEIPSDSMEMTEKLAEIIFGIEDNAKVLEVKGAKITDLRKLVEAFATLKYEYPEAGDGDVMGEALESCNEHAVPVNVLEYFKKRAIYVDGRYLHKSLGEFFAAYGFARRACGLGGEIKDKELLDLVIRHCGDESWGGIVNYFVRKTKLKTLVIPDGVRRIGEGAFFKCSSLMSISIPNSVTSIGNGAFWGCDSLTSVIIPDSVTSIGNFAFNCTSLTDVYYQGDLRGWLKIEFGFGHPMCCAKNLYINGQLLQGDIVIPEGMEKIGVWTFRNCSGLTSITIPNSVTSIGEGAFSVCSGLTSITIPDSVTSIGDSAFQGCRSLTSITIPDSVTSIGEGAFYGCSSLTSITIPDSVTSIGDIVFYNCIGLKSITIPDNVTSIGDRAFYNCIGLKSITIPDSVTSIGWNAFYGCSSLTSIVIPKSVTSIGERAFGWCGMLTSTSINFQGSMKQWKAIDKESSWNYDTGSFTITCTDGVLDKYGNQI